MNSYEIEGKLSNKADKWEVRNLENENRALKNQINELERKIGYLEGVNHNRGAILERLLNMMADHPQFSDLQDEIYQLKCIIY